LLHTKLERKWAALLSHEKGIEKSEKKLKGYNERELEKVLQISIRLPGNGQTTKEKYAL
jgi:hypothetical protein